MKVEKGTIHETYLREEPVATSSDRSFGWVFAAGFSIIGLLPLIGGGKPRVWALAIAAAVFILAVFYPRALSPLNRAWIRLGFLMGRIVNPIVLGLFFFLMLSPVGWFRRRKVDTLGLTFDPDALTYWRQRERLSKPSDLRRQF